MFDGGSLVGGLSSALGGYLGYKGTQETNDASMAMLKQSQAFEHQMRATAYQDTARDLEAAGINKMLAYSQGPSSTPNAPSNPQLKNEGEAIGSAISSSVQSYLNNRSLMKDMETKDAQIQLLQKQGQAQEANAANTEADIEMKKIRNKLLEFELPKAETKAAIDRSWGGRYILTPVERGMEALGKLFGGVTSAVSALK